MDFFNTRMGRKLVERDIPEMVRQMSRLNTNLETYMNRQDKVAKESSPSQVWVGTTEEGVKFTCATREEARKEQAKVEATGITCLLSGPHEVLGS